MKFAQTLLKIFCALGVGVGALVGWRAWQDWYMDKTIEDFYQYKDTPAVQRLLKDVDKTYKGKGIFHIEPTKEYCSAFDFSKWEKEGDPIGISIGFKGAPAEEYIMSEVEVFVFNDGFTTWRSPPDAWAIAPV